MTEFAHTELADQALRDYAKRLELEDGIDPNDAMRMAATVMDGAADRPGATVESVHTCMNLFKRPVNGLSGDDNSLARLDEFASDARLRHFLARKNCDMAGIWLQLFDMDPKEGRLLGDRMQALIDSGKVDALRFSKIFYWKMKEEKRLGYEIPVELMVPLLEKIVSGIEQASSTS